MTIKQQVRASGFTLIELMVTIAVVAILATLAVPSMQNLIRQNRMEGESQRLVGLLTQARNAALTTGRPSFVCRTNNAANVGAAPGAERFACRVGGMDALDWAHEVIVYTQAPGALTAAPLGRFGNQRINVLVPNTVANFQAVKREMVKTISEAPSASVVVTANQNHFVIRFNSDGTLANPAPFRIGVCDTGANPAQFGRIIEIGFAGQVRSSAIEVTDAVRSCTPM